MKNFTPDAAWIGEAVRLALVAVVALKWWQPTQEGLLAIFALISFVVTGLVATRTASARVLERAGTSVDQVKAVANPDLDTRLVVKGSDTHMVPSSPMDDPGKD